MQYLFTPERNAEPLEILSSLKEISEKPLELLPFPTKLILMESLRIGEIEC
jgi:hypothetical protein